jgi:hypothetical protein
MDTKMIRFIDSDYRELFSIPDGAGIRVTYPPGDGREPAVRECKFLDEYHFELSPGRHVYHIAEFAERMEAIGARYEPELQVAAELSPGEAGEARLFYRNDEEGSAAIGILRGDFGRGGDRFFHNWFEMDANRKTPEFRAELQAVMYRLRQDVLKDFGSMAAYCRARPEARLPGEEHRYGFKLETPSRLYFLRCTTLKQDYFYLFPYDKAVPELAKTAEERPSTLARIRAAKTAPKPPRGETAPRKNKHRRDEL